MKDKRSACADPLVGCENLEEERMRSKTPPRDIRCIFVKRDRASVNHAVSFVLSCYYGNFGIMATIFL